LFSVALASIPANRFRRIPPGRDIDTDYPRMKDEADGHFPRTKGCRDHETRIVCRNQDAIRKNYRLRNSTPASAFGADNEATIHTIRINTSPTKYAQ
jgi:hypothetical protein